MDASCHPRLRINKDTIQYNLSLMRPTVILLPRWTNNHYLMPGLNVVIVWIECGK